MIKAWSNNSKIPVGNLNWHNVKTTMVTVSTCFNIETFEFSNLWRLAVYRICTFFSGYPLTALTQQMEERIDRKSFTFKSIYLFNKNFIEFSHIFQDIPQLNKWKGE